MSKKPFKVLQLNKLYYPYIGGIEHVVQQLAEGLSNDFQISVLVCNNRCHYVREKVNGIWVTRVASLGMVGNLPIPFRLTHMLRQQAESQDILHLHMPFPFGDFACLLSGYKGKIVVWWHSDVVRQKKLMFLYRPVMERMLKRADKIIVATKGHIEGSAYLKPYRKKCVVIPFGVDKQVEEAADRYYNRIKEQETIVQHNRKESTKTKYSYQKELEVTNPYFLKESIGTGQYYLKESNASKQDSTKESSPVRFLFIGRLVYYKGCRILLEAFAQVKGAELVIIGDGPMEGELRQLAKDLGVAEHTTFYGKVSQQEIYRQYEACDVFVLPSIARSEAFGLVQIEAMAFGKPVINTRLPSGVPYVSLNGLTGLTVPPEDVAALAKAMRWMTEHKAERLEMGQNARIRMKTEFREEVMLERVKKLYYDVMQGQCL